MKLSKMPLLAGLVAGSLVILFLIAPKLYSAAHEAPEIGALPDVEHPERRPVGLLTSLPIYWNEGDVFAAIGDGSAELPWVRSVLERRYNLLPYDTLTNEEGKGSLDGLSALAIIQPRGLSPADNAALDEWVRSGGRVLIVLDPLLSGEYEAALGDPRHPTVSALVPPVIARWGLSLSFDEAQEEAPRLANWDNVTVPVLMAGELTKVPGDDPSAAGDCTLGAGGVFARCIIGKGSAVVMADAALFEPREGNQEAEKALIALFAKAFS